MVDGLMSGLHEFLPVAILHEWRMKLRDQRQNGVHVLNSFVKGYEGAPFRNDLVLGCRGIHLLGLHVLNKRCEVVGVDLVPKSLLP